MYWEKSKQDTLSNLCLTCTVGALVVIEVKGTNDGTKTDEFSENYIAIFYNGCGCIYKHVGMRAR